jgi:hypothetical protein
VTDKYVGSHHCSARICLANRWKLYAQQPRGGWGETCRAWPHLHTKRDLEQRQRRPAKHLHTAPRSQMWCRRRTPEIASRQANLWVRRRPEETCMPCSRACLTFSMSRAFCGRCSECVLYRICFRMCSLYNVFSTECVLYRMCSLDCPRQGLSAAGYLTHTYTHTGGDAHMPSHIFTPPLPCSLS